MNIYNLLEKLQSDALCDEALRKELLDTEKEDCPFTAFCKKCREKGYPLYEMELINAGEEMYDAMKRSTNGGGANSPLLEYQNDLYELLIASLKR